MSRVRICKRFDFDAAHSLPNVHEGHKCGRLHGHTYVVELHLVGEFDPRLGWFIDYADIASAWAPIYQRVDHRHLNEIEGLENPTTENLCVWLERRLRRQTPIGRFLERVRVYESSTTWCEVASTVGDDPPAEGGAR